MTQDTPIIIVNWNGIEDTKECIESVLKLEKARFKIYLIDNDSEDSQKIELKKLYSNHPQIELSFNDKNLGFTHAHIKIWENELAYLDLNYIVLLNNDTTVDPDWLYKLISSAKENNAHVVASKMINYYDKSVMDNAGHRMLNTGEIIPIGHRDAIEKHNQLNHTLGACAGACLYSTKMLKEIGFFDPHFSTGYEDAELGLRALSTGYKSIFEPNAIVYHKMGQSIKKIFNESYSLMIHSSILYSYFKCMPALNILTALPSFFIKYLSMLIINLIFYRMKFMRIMFKSWISLYRNREIWIKKRKKLSKHRVNYLKHNQLISFFVFDVKRFWNIIVMKRGSAIDNYGNE